MGNGLKLWGADIEAIVKVNKLQPCTNPISMIKNQPTPDGVLSYEIFGTSSQARKETMAYIDLHGHYMYPNAAVKLRSYNRTLSEVLYGTGLYTFDKKTGQFTKDDINGSSGPEFLYQCWPYIQVKEKETFTTKEIEQFFKRDRDSLFITKFLVMPAFFRDINDATGSQMSMSDLNSIYNSIIAYTQNMASYTDMFSSMTYLTQGRVQRLLVELYEKIIIEKVKGNPSKFGMLRRAMLSKNIDYSGLMVICSPQLHTDSPEDVMAKIGYAVIPLARACAMFFPFMVHAVKKFFDRAFLQGGKFPVAYRSTGKFEYIDVTDTYDENEITKMISRYINSPSSRFDPVMTPPLADGSVHELAFIGRYYRTGLEFKRSMTMTDLLYIVAKDTLSDKHVYITRYPLDNYNGQFPTRIELSTTIQTQPVMYGEKQYRFYPVIEGDPTNAFIESIGFSNTYLDAMGGDYDGDTVSVKPIFTIEGNQDAEARINSKGYVLNISGGLMRSISKDFIITAYSLTKTDLTDLKDANVEPPMYAV